MNVSLLKGKTYSAFGKVCAKALEIGWHMMPGLRAKQWYIEHVLNKIVKVITDKQSKEDYTTKHWGASVARLHVIGTCMVIIRQTMVKWETRKEQVDMVLDILNKCDSEKGA